MKSCFSTIINFNSIREFISKTIANHWNRATPLGTTKKEATTNQRPDICGSSLDSSWSLPIKHCTNSNWRSLSGCCNHETIHSTCIACSFQSARMKNSGFFDRMFQRKFLETFSSKIQTLGERLHYHSRTEERKQQQTFWDMNCWLHVFQADKLFSKRPFHLFFFDLIWSNQALFAVGVVAGRFGPVHFHWKMM